MTDKQQNKVNVFFSAFFGFMVFLILYLFKPFGIYSFEGNIFLYTLSFGFITFIVLLVRDFINIYLLRKKIQLFNPSISDKLKGFSIVLPIGILNWINYRIWENDKEFTFLQMIYATLVLGSIPYLYFILFVERKYYLENYYKLKSTIEENKNKPQIKTNSRKIHLITENKKEKLEFYPHELYFIKAEGNYAQFYFYNNERIEKKLFRISLSKIMKQFSEQNLNNFIRNHKSYIVNLQKVEKVTGNTKKYSFCLKDIQKSIPVSRSFSSELIKQLKLVND